MSVYIMHVVHEDERNSYAWLVELNSQQEDEMHAAEDDGWVFQSKVSFGEDDLPRIDLPFNGTVQGQFILYYE